MPKNQFHFCYINNYFNYIINRCEQLFEHKSVQMFSNKSIYVLHEKNTVCGKEREPDSEQFDPVNQELLEFVKETYKNPKHLKILANILSKKKLINNELCFVFNDQIHVADFFSYINNRFDKNDKPTDVRIFKLCKMFKENKIKLPYSCIKNIAARKYLC